ncbi:uncharacterized protein RJT21DRAFT_132283 [Scheffersomyces amazonensis]|uniref:uncharacterized protein n=1 Tax=Scheffersomyces amazonensis TaxID=1078765 RepID=UPI00315D2E8A
MQEILPPANGKKLWRVKRLISSDVTSTSNAATTHAIDSSVECLNNSLRISAAGNRLTTKRPPLRRPKNKPGKPKDFVFVDLSPVKTDESEDEAHHSPIFDGNNQLPSPSQSSIDDCSSQNSSIFEIPQLNESFSSLSTAADDISIFSGAFDTSSILSSVSSQSGSYMQVTPQRQNSEQPLLGLAIANSGISNWDQTQNFNSYPQPQPSVTPAAPNMMITQQLFGYQQAMLQQYQQIQLLQQQLQHQANEIQKQQQQVQQVQKAQQAQQVVQHQITDNIPEVSHPIVHKRSKSAFETSTKRRSSGQFQFKTYTGPKHRHSISDTSSIKKQRRTAKSGSAPSSPNQKLQEQLNSLIKPVGLEDFLMLNDQMSLPLGSQVSESSSIDSTNDGDYETFTPISDYSDEDDHLYNSKPKDIDSNLLNSCGIDQFLFAKPDEFEFANFVSM